MSSFRATMMAAGASVTFLGISALLLLTPTHAEEKPGRPSQPLLTVTPPEQRVLLWTPGRPVLTVIYRVSDKRIYGNRQLLDQNSVLAHGEFNPWRR